ncbi:hypothetical protein QDX21_09545 [Auritidibacter ignavus]|uniref:DUF4913 domain-containing protein n=1 Tax=Auritidibacter ignavus TaxID=678932 RepID=A0AAJ6AMJ9_9MICC|nr:hypothetical protein [Auritidibacter ignavus]PXA82210.1 hypothetical protein DCC26_01500 [Auritidibacter sp. NML120779]WGH92544.1 hypothetical protein QDX21_09545 [Auritidibacter ignavus]WHS29075.1 hypothetical protein QM395_04965 [Auritidibacter ignavus]
MNTTPHDPERPADDAPPGDGGAPDLDSLPPGVLQQVKRMVQAEYAKDLRTQLGTVPRTINWDALTPEDLEAELLALNEWVDWLRHTYGLPPQVVPPMWHRHPELVWELSALRQHWLICYDQQAKGNMGVVWHNDFAAARERLRDWVSISGSRLDRDRPTRITAWPGGEAEDWTPPDTTEQPVTERSADFIAFVLDAVRAREEEQDAAIREIIDDE